MFNKRVAANKDIIGIEKHKLDEARDYINKILGYRVESYYHPYHYEYIDLTQPLPPKKGEEDDFET